ncbi:MAG TPA: asparagine synthase (glutamine-hydrolyzing) [Cryptosporangiaceae bacterium]|nr:asparagine synthase (glutamine-hydrolyzing) [Cryptosporangiaceae bacterium]
MCGLLTYVSSCGDAAARRDAIAGALESIHHRGPDETGVTVSGEDVVLGFKRLSIIDVDLSHQPLEYADGRYVLTFNGEIYNYLALRAELAAEGVRFATQGDTETVVAAYHQWGPDAVKRLRGMFAFIIWDRVERRAFAARDPFGIKPLHYCLTGTGVYVASEKKALLPFSAAAAEGDAGLDPAALSHYLTLQYVPEPGTLHTDVHRLECGESLTWSPDDDAGVVRSRYYVPDFRPTPTDDPAALFVRIREALRESVELHLQSEVPVGAFLSSGIDSTAIVALAREHKPDILTFTVGYEVDGYSEVNVAQTSAQWLGVTTIPTMISAEDMMDTLPRIVWHLDDPVADPALVPLYFVAKKASEHVTVVLSGEGADEFFGGYGIYREPQSLKAITSLPDPMQRGLRAVSRLIPEGVRGKSFLERGTTPLNERYFGNARIFTEAEKQRLMRQYDPEVQYTDVTAGHYRDAADLDPISQMQYIDLFTWLRGDILVKADRMSMAHSLELRVPFLDSGVFDVAKTIPPELKVTAKGVRKYALRQALDGVVPPQIVNRPKLGFPVPTRVWLKDVMYDWARGILADSKAGDLLDLGYADNLLQEHRAGGVDHSRKIWTVLVFCVWHAIFVEGRIDPTPAPAESQLLSKRAVRQGA